MKKLYPYAAMLFMISLSLMPPIDFFIRNPYNDKWLWMVCIAGFLGFFTFFIKTSPVVRFIAIAGFINCFFSCAPYISFTAYVSLIGCCYFYILCTRVEDWSVIFKAAQAVVFLNILLLLFATLHKDSLMNFGFNQTEQFGVVGQHMLMGSFSVVIAAFLLSFNRMNILFPFIVSIACVATWSFFAATIGLFCMIVKRNVKHAFIVLLLLCMAFTGWAFKEYKFGANMYFKSGRIGAWTRTLELSFQHPLTGWGIGTYKDVFPAISRMNCIPYRTAHNFIVQLIFEVGYPFVLIILVSLTAFILRLIRHKLYPQAAGIIMVTCDAMVHFPDRMIQCVLIIVALLAYCEVSLRRWSHESR